MGMIHEILSPGVKDRHKADTCTKMFRIIGKFDKGFGGRPEQEIEHDPRIHDEQGIELRWDSEDHMIVLNGQEILSPILDPPLFPQGLALGTVTVTAGVVGYLDVPAVGALLLMSAQFCRSTCLYCTHDAQVLTRQGMSLPILRAMAAEDVRHLDAARPLHQEQT